jgi:hypothetical protein
MRVFILSIMQKLQTTSILKKLTVFFLLILYFTKGAAQNMGVKLPISTLPNTTLDVNGSTAFREGTALTLANGVNTDVVLTDFSLFRITGPTAAFSITGFTQGKDGRVLTLINATSQILTLTHQTTSAVANQLNTGGTNFNLPANGVATFIYNATLLKWVVTNGFGITNNWSLVGNGGTSPATNFIGTTDVQPLVVKTNGAEAMRILPSGNVGIGTPTPQNKLDVEGGAVIGTGFSGSTTAPTNGLLVEGNVGLGSTLKVGTSPSSINASSALEIESISKGFVPPRMTTAQMNAISAPLVGSLVFNTTLNCLHQYKASTGWDSFCNSATPFTSENLQTSILSQNAGGSGAPFANVPGLGGLSVTIPRAGTYTITLRGYFSGGPAVAAGSDSGAQGSFKLTVDGTDYEESYLASVSLNNVTGVKGTQGTIIKILTLTAGPHTFSMQARTWFGANCNTATWGITTSGYTGSGSVNAAWCKLVIVEN